jgi:hypothetical protein
MPPTVGETRGYGRADRTLCGLGPKQKRSVESILGIWFDLQRSGERALLDYERRKVLEHRGDLLNGALYLVRPKKYSLCLGLLSVRKPVAIVPDDVWLREIFLADSLLSHEARVRQRLAILAE